MRSYVAQRPSATAAKQSIMMKSLPVNPALHANGLTGRDSHHFLIIGGSAYKVLRSSPGRSS